MATLVMDVLTLLRMESKVVGSRQRPETGSNLLFKNLEMNLRNYIFSKKVEFWTCTNRVIHPFYPQNFA